MALFGVWLRLLAATGLACLGWYPGLNLLLRRIPAADDAFYLLPFSLWSVGFAAVPGLPVLAIAAAASVVEFTVFFG